MSVDCVYMLMFPGWERELRSNRWHYASRWSKNVPVVLVQPTEIGPAVRHATEARIPNCRVLHVAATERAYGYFDDSERQAGQILADMRAQGCSRPLLWLYNPQVAAAYGALPAACRLYHATENHFQYAGATEFFRQQARAALRISDVVVAVSSGVAAAIAREVPSLQPRVVTNGCDYAFYAAGSPDRELSAQRKYWPRIAVYAGNINWRLDFSLIMRCAEADARTLFALYGPVADLTGRDRADWAALCARRNVRHFGAVDAEVLPGVYAAADVGLVPYKNDPLLVDNGFPLKVLEMAACGLPVVATKMNPIENLAAAIVVCTDAAAFMRAAAGRSRGALSGAERAELRSVCQLNDYDRKFEQVAELVADASAGAASVRSDEIRAALPVVSGAKGRLHAWLRSAAGVIPGGVRSRTPLLRAQRVLRNWLER